MEHHPYEDMITYSHLCKVAKEMELRKADQCWLGNQGGKGEYAEPNYQLGWSSKNKVLAFNGKSHAPDKNIVFESKHLWPDDRHLTLDELKEIMARARGRGHER
jgi:hypothetical protein